MRPPKNIFHICAKFHKQEKAAEGGGGGGGAVYSQKARFLFFKTRMLKSSVFLYFEQPELDQKLTKKLQISKHGSSW
jgi:hypothetical protein